MIKLAKKNVLLLVESHELTNYRHSTNGHDFLSCKKVNI